VEGKLLNIPEAIASSRDERGVKSKRTNRLVSNLDPRGEKGGILKNG